MSHQTLYLLYMETAEYTYYQTYVITLVSFHPPGHFVGHLSLSLNLPPLTLSLSLSLSPHSLSHFTLLSWSPPAPLHSPHISHLT